MVERARCCTHGMSLVRQGLHAFVLQNKAWKSAVHLPSLVRVLGREGTSDYSEQELMDEVVSSTEVHVHGSPQIPGVGPT